MKFKKLSKSKKRKISQFNKKVGCLFFALFMMLSLATPAFAAVNVEGQGGSNVSLGSVSGQNFYNNADQMWKISKKSDVKCYEQDARYFYNSR